MTGGSSVSCFQEWPSGYDGLRLRIRLRSLADRADPQAKTTLACRSSRLPGPEKNRFQVRFRRRAHCSHQHRSPSSASDARQDDPQVEDRAAREVMGSDGFCASDHDVVSTRSSSLASVHVPQPPQMRCGLRRACNSEALYRVEPSRLQTEAKPRLQAGLRLSPSIHV